MNQNFVCEVCGKTFEKKASMTNHRRWHNLPKYKEFQKNFKENTPSLYKKGHIPWNTGRFREKSANWKGDNIGIDALHYRIKQLHPKPTSCEYCNKPKKLDLHNVSGEYKEILSDWVWICRKCHIELDGRLKKLHDKLPNRKREKGKFIK